ncbi:MAG: hypothetical protein C0412_02190, partial [Flavobacterium sp.]|nr:hypothetical protein [Flavobacterium sp.]
MKKSTFLKFLDVLSSNLDCCLFSKRKISKSNLLGFGVRTVLPFVFMAIAMTSFTVTAQNLPGTVPVLTPIGGFGIDGEGDANFPTAGIGDWFLKTPPYPGTGGSLFDANMNPLYPAMTFFLQDAWGELDPTTFTSSNKINDNPTSYTWGPGNVPDKNEIQNVGVHFAYANPALVPAERANDLWCIFAADRQVTNGDAYIDFEFLQKSLTKSGTISGGFLSEGTADGRTVGDLLVTLIFTNGGTSAEVQIRTWQPASKGYEYVLQSNDDYMGSIYVTNNNAPATVPFDVYGTYPGVYVPNQWVEGAVNLTELLNFGANPCAQVSTLFVRTKTSQAVSAELKDFPVDLIQLNLGAPEVVASCPGNVTLPACSTQDAVNAAFAAWKTGFTYEGGVPPIIQSYAYTGGDPVDMGTLLPPSICGGTISITYTVTDFCEQTDSCTATFTVTAPAPAVIVDLPDYALEGCNPAWPSVVSTTYTFCGVEGTINGVAGDVQTDGCTQYIDYTFNYTDSCSNQAASQVTRVSRHYDMTAPVIVDLPDYALEGCNPAWPTVVSTTYTDNCDDAGSLEGVA